MLTWAGFLGKVLSFLASKLAGKAFDRLGQNKAVAAEALIRIYVAIAELEALGFEVLRGAKDSLEQSNSTFLISSVFQVERDVEAQTRSLTNALITLGPVLAIFDPPLAEALACVCAWKYNILYEASRSMAWERSPGEQGIVRLRFKNPRDRIFDLDLESHYQWLQTNAEYKNWKDEDWLTRDSIENWKTLEWPQTLLMQNKVDEIFEDSEVDPNVSDMEIINELASKLERHLRLLSSAREQLKILIKNKLSMDDVLYVSSKIGR